MAEAAVSDSPFLHREVEEAQETGYESLVQKTLDGDNSLSVLVEGVTCALCIQKIETALSAQGDIRVARLNFGARRLLIEWGGAPSRANDFVRIVEKLGYGVQFYDEKAVKEHQKSEERFLLLCLGVAGFAMGNVMLLSVGVWSTSAETMGMATRDFLHWIAAFIALPAVLFSGRPFFRSALKVLSKGHTNMDVPISLALILASGSSLFETVNHGEHVYFDSAIMLTFFLLIGRYLDFKARESARSSAHDLLQSFQGFATVVDGNQTRRLLIRDLKEGMLVRVATGESFPVDGVIYEGKSSVDTSLVTGETLPRDLKTGDDVFAGTLNLSAPVMLRVVKAADASLLSDIVRLMDKAGQAQAAYVRVADKAAKLYTPLVHSLALLTFLGWMLLGAAVWQDALMIAITVLIITCPCALALAVPVVQVLATGKLMKSGVFVKSGDALERLAVIDTAIFDKTGTLTLGKPALMGEHDDEVLQLAASLAVHSAHPLSKALVNAFDGSYLSIEDVHEYPGQGLSGQHDGQSIKMGSSSFCAGKKSKASKGLEIWLSVEGKQAVQFCFEDDLRTDALQVVEDFKKQGVEPVLLSGDRESVVQAMAKKTQIDTVYGEQTPVQKFAVLEGLQDQGHKILMVGDGLNDAPVLAKADVSMAPGAAVDMAQNAADIVFMGDKLAPVYEAYKVARKTQLLVKQNFTLAVIYNLIAIPIAVAGFVTPFIAALAMSGSSLLVIANSFRLKLSS
jgi:Cu2+-exporting ATPase